MGLLLAGTRALDHRRGMPTDPISPPDLRDGAPSVYDDPGLGADSALDAFVEPMETEPVEPAALLAHYVTAVLVAHDGERWLPRALAALAAAERPPDRLIAVDTGSRDRTPSLLDEALGEYSVVIVARLDGIRSGRPSRPGRRRRPNTRPDNLARAGRVDLAASRRLRPGSGRAASVARVRRA